MTEPPRQLAIVRTYDDLHAAMRARADELAVTRETIDAVSGLQSGYSGKVLAPRPIKRLGPTTLPLMLGALGLALIVVEDDLALARVKPQLVKRRVKAMPSTASHFSLTRRFFKQIGRNGGKARLKTMTPKQRQMSARRAANARWANHRSMGGSSLRKPGKARKVPNAQT